MGLKLRAALLSCLAATAAYTGVKAYRSIVPAAEAVPEEVYASFAGREDSAEFFLRPCDGFVAVYDGRREKTPVSVTDIELANLRGADRALVQRGIPVENRRELLRLLEDLGS